MNSEQRAMLERALRSMTLDLEQGRLFATGRVTASIELRLWDEDQVWVRRGEHAAVVAVGPAWLGFGARIGDESDPRAVVDPTVVRAARKLSEYGGQANPPVGQVVDLLA
jgi:hypothetical protein